MIYTKSSRAYKVYYYLQPNISNTISLSIDSFISLHLKSIRRKIIPRFHFIFSAFLIIFLFWLAFYVPFYSYNVVDLQAPPQSEKLRFRFSTELRSGI